MPYKDKEKKRARDRHQYTLNPEKFRQKSRIFEENFKKKNGVHRRTAKRYAKYGLTLTQWGEIKKGGCEICGRHTNLVCDHNHLTGKFRGCLCSSCNSSMGTFERMGMIQKLIKYLNSEPIHPLILTGIDYGKR